MNELQMKTEDFHKSFSLVPSADKFEGQNWLIEVFCL